MASGNESESKMKGEALLEQSVEKDIENASNTLNNVKEEDKEDPIDIIVIDDNPSPEIQENGKSLGSPEEINKLKNDIEANKLDKKWKSIVDFCIVEMITQLLNYSSYKPKNNLSRLDNNEDEKDNNEAQGQYNSNLNQFGKLGKLIGTQVFEFEQWDEFESLNPPKIHELIQELINLRLLVTQVKDLKEIDSLILLKPFLEIIKNGDNLGQLTKVALHGLEQFLKFNIINSNTQNAFKALDQIANSLIKSQSDGKGKDADEMVILKLVQVMELLVKEKHFVLFLTKKHVDSILNTAIHLACKPKTTQLFRHQCEVLIMNMISNLILILLDNPMNLISLFEKIISLLEPHNAKHSNYMRLLGLGIIKDSLIKYGLELFKNENLNILFCNNLSGYLWMYIESDHLSIITKTLDLISILIQIAQPHLKQQQLMWIQQIILRLTNLNNNYNITYHHPKNHEILFLLSNFLIQHINIHPSLVNELFVNFDCCLNQPDILIDLITFLIESAIRYASNNNNIWLELIKNILINFIIKANIKPQNEVIMKLSNIKGLINSFNLNIITNPITYNEFYSNYNINEILESRNKKKVIREAILLFNQKPWNGLDYLINNNLLPSKEDVKFNIMVSKFLLSTSGLDKKLLGEFIAKKSNSNLLEAFISEFNFKNKRIDEAMREFLESFRLPGESALIERIFEVFSDKYFQSGPQFIETKDAVFILAYSIIMVNTDLYNKQVKKRMQFVDYAKNLRGVNNGKDFDQKFLKSIYDSIASNEIVLPEEQGGKISLEYKWKVVTQNPSVKGAYYLCSPGQYDKEVFLYIFNNLVDFFIDNLSKGVSDIIIQDSLQGLYLILLLSNHFESSEVIDYVIRRMIILTGSIYANQEISQDEEIKQLEDETFISLPRPMAINRTQQVDNQILSDLSLKLGQSYKSQIITIFLMNIFNEIPKSIFNGWWDILDIIRLFIDSFILPINYLKVPDIEIKDEFNINYISIPFKPLISSNIKNITLNRRQNSAPPESIKLLEEEDNNNLNDKNDIVSTEISNGLFSTLSSYLGYSNIHPDLIWDLSPQLLFANLNSVKKMIPVCNFEGALNILSKIDDNFESILKRIMIIIKTQHNVNEEPNNDPFVKKLPLPIENELNSDISLLTSTSATLINRPNTPSSVNSQKTLNSKRLDKYFPSTAFFFHWIVHSTISKKDSYNHWNLIISFFGDIFYHADYYHPYLIKRAVIELLNILICFFKRDSVVQFDDVCCIKILDILASLSPTVIEISSQPLLATFKFIRQANPNIFKNVNYWATCLHILQNTVNQDDNLLIKESFSLLQQLSQSIKYVNVDNSDYLVIINLLVEFSNPDRFIRSSNDIIEPIIERSLLAIQDLSYHVKSINQNIKLDSKYYLPPLIGLSSLSNHRRKEIRNQAFYLLKRSIMSQDLFSSSQEHTIKDWEPIFERVLFPLAEKSLEPKPRRKIEDTNNESIEESRSRIVSLISSLFLHFINTCILNNDKYNNNNNNDNGNDEDDEIYNSFTPLWIQVIDFLLRLIIHPNDPKNLLEAVLENLKNLLLVLTSTNLLLPPNEDYINNNNNDNEVKSKRLQMSIHTWALINESIPNLISQIFPTKIKSSPTELVEALSGKNLVEKVIEQVKHDSAEVNQIIPEIDSNNNKEIEAQQTAIPELTKIVQPEIISDFIDEVNQPVENLIKEQPEVIIETSLELNQSGIKLTKEESKELPPSPTALAYGYL